jgi:uncharacterized Zn finger protein
MSIKDNNIICPHCGQDSGVSKVLCYYGPPLRCRVCGNPLWENIVISC